MAEVGDGAWTRDSLEAAGFVGWITFAALTNALTDVPQTGGVYVVIQAAGAEPECLNSNPGGRFKDRDPTVDAAVLEANWVDGAEVVYIGKADNLRRRLRQFGQCISPLPATSPTEPQPRPAVAPRDEWKPPRPQSYQTN